MSGGHWNYQEFKLDEAAARVSGAMLVLAEIEHQLDWGIASDTCYECAKLRVIAGLEAYFDNVSGKDEEREPLAVVRGEREVHVCRTCRFGKFGPLYVARRAADDAREEAFRYRCSKCGAVKDVEREPAKADLPVPCWNRACWDAYHGEPALMYLVGPVDGTVVCSA